jgi:chromosome segregation ATPase
MQLTRQEHKDMCDETERLKAQITKLTGDLAASAKKLSEVETNYKNCSELRTKAEGQLEEAQAMVDLFPGAPPRQSKEEDTWKRKDYSLASRLAGWMAAK